MRALVAGGVLTVLATGCGVTSMTYSLASTAEAHGAYAGVDATFDENQHATHLTLHTEALVRPSRVASDARYFVIWGRRARATPWVRAGSLAYDEWGSAGTFRGTLPDTEFDLEITAEKDYATQVPSPHVLFAQHIGPPLRMDGSPPAGT